MSIKISRSEQTMASTSDDSDSARILPGSVGVNFPVLSGSSGSERNVNDGAQGLPYLSIFSIVQVDF